MTVLYKLDRATSKIENRWLKSIPADWVLTRLRFVCDVATGSGDTQDSESSGAYDFFVRSPHPLRSTTYSFDTEAVLTAGDGAVGEVFHHVTGKFHAHQRVYVLSNFRGILPRYFYYYFSSFFRLMAQDGSARTTVDSVRRWMLTDMPFVLPPLDEQRAIADYLDQETAQIDALAAKQEEFKAKLTERRIALISSAVIRGLDPETPIKTSGADWFEAVPSHWRVERLKNSILDAQTGAWGNDPVGDGSDVLCVRVADFDRPLLRVGNAKTMRAVNSKDARPRLLQQGDLLLEKSGGTPLNPVGFVAMYEDAKGPAVTSNFITRLRLKDDQDPRYWLYAHATSYGTRLTARSVKQTTGIQNLDQASYFNELFPYPPLEEQRDIAAYLDKETSRIDTLIAKAEEHIALTKERRSALITAAVTGQFDVRTARKAG